MDKILRPERLEVDSGSSTAADDFKHWHKTFTNYIAALETPEREINKLQVLINLLSP